VKYIINVLRIIFSLIVFILTLAVITSLIYYFLNGSSETINPHLIGYLVFYWVLSVVLLYVFRSLYSRYGYE
jgi:hypothetical protein